MMRIAEAEGKNVTEHFGHCEGFLIYDAENGEILKEEMVLNPWHKPGFLPNFGRPRCKSYYQRWYGWRCH